MLKHCGGGKKGYKNHGKKKDHGYPKVLGRF